MTKKKQRYSRPRKNILVAAAIVLALGAGYLTYYFAHRHAIAVDKARFTVAQKDVTAVANQVEAAIGPPQDRQDGNKCSYAHQKYTKGPLSCDVYSYLAYGVGGPDDVNAIVQKVDALSALHGNPWKFEAVTEKPHEFVDGVNYSDNFTVLRDLFDTEIKSSSYIGHDSSLSCSLSYLYHNSLSHVGGYPDLTTASSQTLLIALSCSDSSKAAYFPIQE